MVKVISNIAIYQCLTTDTKPTENVPDGSELTTFNATTDEVADHYKWHDGDWYKFV